MSPNIEGKYTILALIMMAVLVSGCAQTTQDKTGLDNVSEENVDRSTTGESSLAAQFEQYNVVKYNQHDNGDGTISLIVRKQPQEYEIWARDKLNLSRIVLNSEFNSEAEAAEDAINTICPPMQKKAFESETFHKNLNKLPVGHQSSFYVLANGETIRENYTVKTEQIQQLMKNYEPKIISFSIWDIDRKGVKVNCKVTGKTKDEMEITTLPPVE